MSQTSYSAQYAVGRAGMKADDGVVDVLSRVNVGIRVFFGRAVVRATDPDTEIKLPTTSGEVAKLVGVSLLDLALESNDGDGLDPNYPAGSDVACLAKGRVWVKVEDAVTPDSSVYVRYAGKKQTQTIVLDADLVTGNTIAGTLGATAISVAFDTDHATTMANLETAVEAVAGIESATVGGASNRTLTIVTEQDYADVDLGGDFAVTDGGSQAGVTEAETVAAVHTRERGAFRTDADSSSAAANTKMKFLTSASAGGLAMLQIDN